MKIYRKRIIMPKLQGIEEKYINGIKVDKENDVCFFNDEFHKYYNKQDMKPYISVTQLVAAYEQPFQEDFWASYKALEKILDAENFSIIKKTLLTTKTFDKRIIKKLDINPNDFESVRQSILKEWKDKKEEACQHGSEQHLIKELSFYGNKHFDLSRYGFKDCVGDYDCTYNYYKLDKERAIYPEFLIAIDYDGLRISGQADLIIKDGNDIYIGDWKTNAELKTTSYYDKRTKSNVMMKYPLNTIQDCSMGHYTCQLSLYAFMLQYINPNFNIKQLEIIHIDRNGKETLYPVEYKKKEIENLLAHYKKMKKIQEELDKDKPFII